MNLKSDRWVVGQDYFEAPTCATCHMSATKKQDVTHDVGNRISWNNRPPVSSASRRKLSVRLLRLMEAVMPSWA